jgi:ketosteroid isomerase-like protein
MKNLAIFILGLLFFGCQTQVEEIDENKLTVQLNQFIDEWHLNAAQADTAYFSKIAENGIYIGTAKEELWTKDEFFNFAKKYFERGETWDFKATERNIYFSKDHQYAWFDELLDTWMGTCRASGVLEKTGQEWKIAHYHLSMCVPNEVVREVIDIIGE